MRRVAAVWLLCLHALRPLHAQEWASSGWEPSHLRCTGARWRTRCCHFTNLAYDTSLHVFKFHTPNPSQLRHMVGRVLRGNREFLKIGPNFAQRTTARDAAFVISFLGTPFPPAANVTVERRPVYLHTALHPHSFGHVLRDTVNVVAHNLHALQLANLPRALLVTNATVSDVLRKYAVYAASEVETWAAALARAPTRYVLFRDIVVGYGGRDLRGSKVEALMCGREQMAPQRALGYRLANVTLTDARALRPPRVLLLDRDLSDPRRITNVVELAAALRASLPGVRVAAHTLRHLSARDQLRYLSETSVLVTTGGSASFRMVYLPTDAHVVVVGAPEDATHTQDWAFHEVEQCWKHVGYLHFWYYRVTERSEWTVRYIRPGFEDNAKFHRWDADVRVDAGRLRDLVGAALEQIVLPA